MEDFTILIEITQLEKKKKIYKKLCQIHSDKNLSKQ